MELELLSSEVFIFFWESKSHYIIISNLKFLTPISKTINIIVLDFAFLKLIFNEFQCVVKMATCRVISLTVTDEETPKHYLPIKATIKLPKTVRINFLETLKSSFKTYNN